MAVATARPLPAGALPARAIVPAGLLALGVVVSLISLGIGAGRVPVTGVVGGLLDAHSPYATVVRDFRLPRILLCWLVGMGLGVGGGALQGVIRNPLAAPDIVGVTKGAGIGAIILLITIPDAPVVSIPIAAFLGGVAAMLLVYLFAYRRGSTPARLALVGIAVSAVCESAIRYVLVKFPLNINAGLVWLTGSLFGRSMQDVLEILPWIVVLVPVAIYCAHRLDVLGLGDDLAQGLGERVERTRFLMMMLAVALAASSVAVAGTVGFVGLIAPHIARRLVGGRHGALLPAAGLVGALLMLFADTVGRGIAPPLEIPCGLVTAVIGGPYFLYLLTRLGR